MVSRKQYNNLWSVEEKLEVDLPCVFRDELHRNPSGFCKICFPYRDTTASSAPFPQEAPNWALHKHHLHTQQAGAAKNHHTELSANTSESKPRLKLPLNPNFQWH